MKEVILNSGVNNIPKAGVDVISKDALTRMRRGARFTLNVKVINIPKAGVDVIPKAGTDKKS